MMVARRWFLRHACAAASGVPVAALVQQCAVSGVVLRPVSITDGEIRVPLGDWEVVRERGGLMQLSHPQLEGDLFLTADDDAPAVALSSICSHMGCPVEFDGAGFTCPCHESQYARDGAVITGPAPRALRRFPIRVDNGALVISLTA